MYLRAVRLKNIKGFHDTQLTFPRPKQSGNWHVILGDNGTGKTTILQAIALALVNAQEFLDHPEDWVRQGAGEGECTAQFVRIKPERASLETKYTVLRPTDDDRLVAGEDVFHRNTPAALSDGLRGGTASPLLVAGYGALRRMEAQRSSRLRPTLEDTVQSLFASSYELRDLEDWLMRLDYMAKDVARPQEHRVVLADRLQAILRIVDSLLPKDPLFEFKGVDSRGAFFSGPQGETLLLRDLSEGYRAVFAIAVDLLFLAHLVAPDHVLFAQDKEGHPFVTLEGIVLIDEIDTHLHPKWQQQIGPYLQRAFPRVQFIVTTHSPFVAQAATEGGLFVLEWTPAGVTVDQPPSAVQTWAAEEILESPVFGLETTRRPEVEQDLNEYTRLKARAEVEQLSQKDQQRLERLKKKLKPALPPPGNAEETLEELMRRIQDARREP